MADLVAIGYPDETTASLAAEEVQRLASELIIEPDAVAVIVRDKEGKYHVHTSHHPVGGGATWGMFWGLLFGMLKAAQPLMQSQGIPREIASIIQSSIVLFVAMKLGIEALLDMAKRNREARP